jgi:Zn-dependent M16 (insulinase) family peptidase
MKNPKLNTGDVLHGFKVRNIENLHELNSLLIQLDHQETGARWVHLQNEDTNNLFAVGFRTPPNDSTGIAHILEHTALCGSRRYPVRDPFFSMLKRSLNTFMNAMTASDWTVYPFATQNRKDFRNLLGIYLDASFFPLLRENDFLQEGHRLEFKNPTDSTSPLEYKGVVYNEMKGAMASPSSLLYRRMGKALYPTTCYHFNSGGEPADIPDLTWSDLRQFHSRYYHPSNALFYSYGNIPLEEHLQAVSEQVMSQFSKLEIDSSIPPEQLLTSPQQLTEYFPIDPGENIENKSIVQTAWLTCDIEQSLDRLSLNLLSMLLLGNPAAPLHKALLDSKLGGNLAPGSGFQDENRTTYFAAGLQATEPDKTAAIEDLILDTLKTTVNVGFSQERVEGVIHRLEFSQREVTGDRYPYALGLLMKIMGPWLHADDPISVLKLESNLKQIRNNIKDRDYFPDLIDRYLLNNKHRVTLTLAPDKNMQEEIDRATTEKLSSIAKKLSSEQKNQIITKASELKNIQESEEDLSCLPTLELSDIPEHEEPVEARNSRVSTVDIEWFDQPTNGISYFSSYLPVKGLEPQLSPYLPLYCSIATQIGAAGKSYTEMAEQVEAHTGGVHLNCEVLDDPQNADQFEAVISVRGKALNHKQDELFRIIGDYLTEPDFNDTDRIRTVLRQLQTSFENAIPGSGHLYAARAGAACLSKAAQIREQWSGISLLHLVRKLTAMDDGEIKVEIAKLVKISNFLINRNNFSCAITGEQATFEATEKNLAKFLKRLPEGKPDSGKEAIKSEPEPGQFGWATSVPVSYVTRTFKTVPFSHPDSAALLILAKLLRSGYLHREIREKGGAYGREKGGAYGGLASCNIEGGLFSLLSYRDPHILRTLGVYDDAIAWAVSGNFNDEAIKEAQLSVFADLDRPLSPGSRGIHEFANNRQGLTLEKRQQLRQQLLNITKAEICAAAKKHLAENSLKVDSIVSSEEMLTNANAELKEKIDIKRI